MQVIYLGRGSHALHVFAVRTGPATLHFDMSDAGDIVGSMPLVEPYASRCADKARAILAKK